MAVTEIHNPSIKVLASALEQLADMFCIYDKKYRLVYANGAAFKAMPIYFNTLNEGGSTREAIENAIRADNAELDDEAITAICDGFNIRLRSGDPYEIRLANGQSMQIQKTTLENGYMLVLGIDVTKLKKQKAQMASLAEENHQLANTDQLTGLANRRNFIEQLNRKIIENQSESSGFYVGLIDLNGFKRINDIYGHSTGDKLLAGFARRASQFTDSNTFIARLGGDEFALISDGGLSEAQLISFSQTLCDVLSQPQTFAGNDLSVSTGLGWATYPKDGSTPSDLLKKADYALYKSKKSKTRNAVLFSENDETKMLRESEISRQLETADLEAEISMQFQPIHNTKSQSVISFEALMRWENSELGFIASKEFVPLAEKTGQISKLTKIGLKKALDVAKHWPKTIDLHFNISGIDLGKIEVVKALIESIKDSGYPTESVVFEVTETALVDTFENISHVLSLLRKSGLQLALDDFGTGFSSLSYLARIPVTCLKMDKSFTERLQPGSYEEQILKTVNHLCTNLNLHSVIEGVETQSQVDQLSAMNLYGLQGHYFSRALDPQDIGAYLINHIVACKIKTPDWNTPREDVLSQDRERAKLSTSKSVN